jgi:hypothetical protein
MKIFSIDHDITVFGKIVDTFPDGIGQAFDEIIHKIPDGLARSRYGISSWSGERMIYIAAVEQESEGEAKQYGYDTFSIERGNYGIEEVRGWRDKTDSIKEMFEKMCRSIPGLDLMKPCVEWYKNDDVMWCMLKSKS